MPLVIQHAEDTRLKVGPDADVAWANIGHGLIRWRIDTALVIKAERLVFHPHARAPFVFDVPCGHEVRIGNAKLKTTYDSVQAAIRVEATSPADTMRIERTHDRMPVPRPEKAEGGQAA